MEAEEISPFIVLPVSVQHLWSPPKKQHMHYHIIHAPALAPSHALMVALALILTNTLLHLQKLHQPHLYLQQLHLALIYLSPLHLSQLYLLTG